MALGAAGQEQRGPQQIAVGRGQADVVDENIVKRSLSHCDFLMPFAALSKCEFGFSRKGLVPT
jgi:hypothetical protein